MMVIVGDAGGEVESVGVGIESRPCLSVVGWSRLAGIRAFTVTNFIIVYCNTGYTSCFPNIHSQRIPGIRMSKPFCSQIRLANITKLHGDPKYGCSAKMSEIIQRKWCVLYNFTAKRPYGGVVALIDEVISSSLVG